MSLTALSKDLANIKQRRSSVFVASHASPSAPTRATATWYNLGEVRDAKLTWEPINTAKSTTGKVHQVGASVNLTFTMMQTSDTELAAMDELVRENDYGTTFKITDGPCSGGDAVADTVAGIIIENGGVQIVGDIDLGGGDSGLVVTVTGETDMAGLALIGVPKGAADPNGYAEFERVLAFSTC